MISRTVRIQLAIFLIISFFGVAYTGFNYVGIHTIGPVHFSPSPYTVKMYLTDSGGIYETAPVTYRGVQVGTVGSLHLVPADTTNQADPGGGVEVDLHINHDVRLPVDTLAQVADLSAVGEQYVNLTPQTDAGPYMAGATAVIPVANTAIPVSDAVLLQNLDDLVNSVDKQNLTTVITQLAVATDGTGPDLQRLITSGDALLQSAQTALPQTLKLIDDGKTVLTTQEQVAGDLKTFSHNLNLLSEQLDVSDPSIRSLLDNGVTSAQTLQSLLAANQKDLPTLLSNLITLGKIADDRLPGVQEILVLYPFVISDAYTALDDIPSEGGNVAQFAAALTNTAPSCNLSDASGYQSTVHRNENPNSGNTTVPFGFGGGVNLNTLCTAPDQSPNGVNGGASGTSSARGAPTVPRPAGDTTGEPGGSIGTTTNPNVPNYVSPSGTTGQGFTENGSSYTLGSQPEEPSDYAGSALSFLLLSGAEG